MTLDEFRKTARIVREAELERIEYLGGAAQIDLVIGKGSENGMFCLTIANASEQGFDLAKLEGQLFEWADGEVINND